MNGASPQGITELLIAWRAGDRSAFEKLLPLVERELHQIAHRYMSHEKPGHTLQTTAQIMRRILVNHARDQAAAKRGAGAQKISLDEVAVISDERADELLALDDALDTLTKLDKRKSQVVELRYFGGLSVEEIAEVLSIHPDTVTREWG